MKIRVTVCNTVPTKHAGRVINPKIEVEDEVLAGENSMQAGRRISLIATAMFAREVLDQLRFTDRMAHTSNEQWCDEYLSTVAEDHPAMKPVAASAPIPALLTKAIQGGVQTFQEILKDDKQQVPPAGA